jgi:hypothetical protein
MRKGSGLKKAKKRKEKNSYFGALDFSLWRAKGLWGSKNTVFKPCNIFLLQTASEWGKCY